MWFDITAARVPLDGSSGNGRRAPAAAARVLAMAMAVAGAAYPAVTAAAAVWGSLTLTQTRKYGYSPSVRLRQALGGSPSPTRGDEPLWHPAAALTAWSTTGSGAVFELAGAAVDVPGLWGLAWHDRGERGYAQLGDVLVARTDDNVSGGRVVRRQSRVLIGDLDQLPSTHDGRTNAALCAYA